MLKKTPIQKIDIEFKDYITGRDEEDIQRPITSVKFQIGVKGEGSGEINAGEAIEKSKHIAIQRVVLSVNGKTENVLDAVLDLHKDDYKFVMEEVDKVVKGDFTKPSSKTQDAGIK
jgi:hypothetical protein